MQRTQFLLSACLALCRVRIGATGDAAGLLPTLSTVASDGRVASLHTDPVSGAVGMSCPRGARLGVQQGDSGDAAGTRHLRVVVANRRMAWRVSPPPTVALGRDDAARIRARPAAATRAWWCCAGVAAASRRDAGVHHRRHGLKDDASAARPPSARRVSPLHWRQAFRRPCCGRLYLGQPRRSRPAAGPAPRPALLHDGIAAGPDRHRTWTAAPEHGAGAASRGFAFAFVGEGRC